LSFLAGISATWQHWHPSHLFVFISPTSFAEQLCGQIGPAHAVGQVAPPLHAVPHRVRSLGVATVYFSTKEITKRRTGQVVFELSIF
jgi:hypothetical protein